MQYIKDIVKRHPARTWLAYAIVTCTLSTIMFVLWNPDANNDPYEYILSLLLKMIAVIQTVVAFGSTYSEYKEQHEAAKVNLNADAYNNLL